VGRGATRRSWAPSVPEFRDTENYLRMMER
jgi:hypothetical protein